MTRAQAALILAGELPADAAEAVFGVARAAGWIPHALEEYREQPLRWRGRELYIGSRPAGAAVRQHTAFPPGGQ